MDYIHTKEEMPTEAHYAIMEFDRVRIPGDERSRTNPGHGYPEHTEKFCRYIAFKDKGEWEKEVKTRTATNAGISGNTFVAFHVDAVAEVKLEPTPLTVK